LVKWHGWWRFLLHDDFYDENGEASQPQIEVVDKTLYPIPSFNDVREAPNELLDWTITRWRLAPSVADAWRELPATLVIESLQYRLSTSRNGHVVSRIMEICGKALSDCAAPLVDEGWRRFPAGCPLWTLAEASAACLAFDDGFGRVRTAIESLEEAPRRDALLALAHFRSPKSLDWIEEHYFEPAAECWGRLAALSSVSWARIVKWLNCGRPLSLVGLDAVREMYNDRVPLIRALRPNLVDPPALDALTSSIVEYASKDDAPRVQQAAKSILQNSHRVLAGWRLRN
jgi:hypothetical protein